MMRDSRHSVIWDVVEPGFCVGCGTCAAVCPRDALKMDFNLYGEYNPVPDEKCNSCGICLRVCPFTNTDENEDSIAQRLYSGSDHRQECGYFIESFAGYVNDPDSRKQSASGGLATWFLAELLRQDIVDAVALVRPNPDPDKLFTYSVAETPEQVISASGSAYYPVEWSRIMRNLAQDNRRYAVVGLPCFIKAARKAASQDPRLASNIIICAGLVCEMLHCKLFTEYLTAAAGGFPGKSHRVMFRKKIMDTTSRDYCFAWEDENNGTGHVHLGHVCGRAGGAVKWLFKLNSCNYCDDVFAETADIVFMDAWLPEYEKDCAGTNLVIARGSVARDILQSGNDGGAITIRDVSIDRIVTSQAPVLKSKRTDLAVRLKLAAENNIRVPDKRVEPLSETCPADIRRQKVLMSVQSQGKAAWLKYGSADIDSYHAAVPALNKMLKSEKNTALKNRIIWGVANRLKAAVGVGRDSD